MFISRFWTLLLALTVGILLAVIMLAKDVVNRDRVRSATAVLYKERTKCDVALKLHARNRLDVLLSVAVDPQIRRMLAVASFKPNKTSTIREQLLTALRNHNKELGKYRADMLMALDRSGKVTAQVGMNERRFGHSLKGFPVVNAALRGYQRDDVLKLGNDVFLVAARPVIEQGQYVGALVHGMKINERIASDLSPGMQLAFYANDVVLAAGMPRTKGVARVQGSFIGKPLDQIKASVHYKEKGYSEVVPITTKEGKYMAVYSLVRGEAAASGVGYAVITSLEELTSPTEFYQKAGTEEIDALPTGMIAGLILLAAAIGWALMYLEGQRPVYRLYAHLKELEQGDPKDQLNVYRFRRRIRKIATAINTLIDKKMKAMVETAGSDQKSIDSILGNNDSSRLSTAKFKFIEPTSSEIPPPPPPADEPIAPKAPNPGRISISMTGPSMVMKKPGSSSSPPSAGTSDAPIQSGVEDEQEYFRKIFDEFVSLKKNLGEPIDHLNFERFEGTLKRNRDTLKARYGCKKVLFQVYEKDGKTSLKATPIRN